MSYFEAANLAVHELSIEERRNRSNAFPVTHETKMVNVETGEHLMTYAQWMSVGRLVGLRARVALMDRGIPTGNSYDQDKRDQADLLAIEKAALTAYLAQEAALVEPEFRAFTPEQQQLRDELDALNAERAPQDEKELATFLGAISILENEPDSEEGQRLASHIKGAGEVLYPSLPVEPIIPVVHMTEAA